MLLDECTSNLDADTEATILANMWPLLEGKTVVIITHHPAAVEGLVDEVIAICEGRVAWRAPSVEMPAFSNGIVAEPVG